MLGDMHPVLKRKFLFWVTLAVPFICLLVFGFPAWAMRHEDPEFTRSFSILGVGSYLYMVYSAYKGFRNFEKNEDVDEYFHNKKKYDDNAEK